MERKFKVGDKVRFVGDVDMHTNPEVLICHQDNLTVRNILDDDTVSVIWSISSLYKYYTWVMKTNEIELIEFTKDSLQPGDVITVRNGDKLYLSSNGYFVDIEGERFNSIASRGDLTKDLLCDGDDRDSDIMKVERPIYHTVYERVEEKKEPKKMTVAEISKELGYDVEIVKG